MKNWFRKSAAKTASSPDDIAIAAAADCDYRKKLPLLQAVTAKADAGDTAPLATFLLQYLIFKRDDGAWERAHEGGLCDGYIHLACRPVIRHIENSMDGPAALQDLTKNFPPFYRQMLVDLALRRATATGSWIAVETLLTARADPNAANGRPLASAVREGYADVVQQLLLAGAKPEISQKFYGMDMARFALLRDAPTQINPAPVLPPEPPILKLGKQPIDIKR